MDVGWWLVIFHDGSLWSIMVLWWLIMVTMLNDGLNIFKSGLYGCIYIVGSSPKSSSRKMIMAWCVALMLESQADRAGVLDQHGDIRGDGSSKATGSTTGSLLEATISHGMEWHWSCPWNGTGIFFFSLKFIRRFASDRNLVHRGTNLLWLVYFLGVPFKKPYIHI